MKFSTAAILSTIGSAAAFVSPSVSQTTAILRMSEATVEEVEVPDIPTPEAPKEPELPAMSASMPFMARPLALDGSLAGDVGFDPLGFAKSKEDLLTYREAEIKHARLAMLAAAGWPLSELFDGKLANAFGLDPLLVGDRAPSILNGGLGNVSPVYWIVCLAGAAAIDLYGINASKNKANYVPGNLGFDPLGLYPQDKDGQDWFQTAELKNGRLAMIAITAFAVQEVVSKVGVVNETPLFFKPLGETLHQLTNSGYIH